MIKLRDENKKIKKSGIVVVILLVIIVAIIVAFAGWFIKPSKKLNIAVLDTTVPATDSQGTSATNRYYRKHSGFFWLLNQQKYVKTNGKKYDYKKDYYGPLIDENGEYTKVNKLSDIKQIPDLLYLADVYGSELYDNKYSGLSTEDMNTVSLTQSKGGTVVGEMELLGSIKDDTISDDIRKMFGFKSTSWSGRYVVNLSDLSDVPSWAPSTYENQYGVKWKFTGPGLILTSTSGEIIVLEEKTDFNSKNLISVSVHDKYKKEFSACKKSNFYNWFELIEVQNGADTIADYNLNLNATGMEKIKKISSDSVFAAVVRKKTANQGTTYYFAGDFNDCTNDSRIYSFLGADMFFKALSFDKEGDISQFYWKFYNPLMKKILKETYENKDNVNVSGKTEKEKQVKISNTRFQIATNGAYKEFNLKAANINLDEPGSSDSSRNYSYYKQILDEAVDMGLNTVRVYDLAPPEFYRALYDVNEKKDNTLYLIQTVKAGANENRKEEVDEIFEAIHGKGTVERTLSNNKKEKWSYIHDVSPYVISYVADVDVLAQNNEQNSYNGKYLSATGSVSNYAEIVDYMYDSQKTKYNNILPVGLHVDINKLSKSFWNQSDNEKLIDLTGLNVNDDVSEKFYIASNPNITDSNFQNNQKKFATYNDAEGTFYYGGYIQYIKSIVTPYPLLIDGFGISTNGNIYATNETYSGLSETSQGEVDVRMLDAILTNGCVGGIIADLNDSWSSASGKAAQAIVPITNNCLWHDLTDPAQTTGILAVKAKDSEDVGLELKDFETMKKMQLSVNSEYLYISVSLEKEMDFKNSELIVGLDTYERNNGEYFYSKGYFANSLSGMEYIVRITGTKEAALYVCSSYYRNNKTVSSKESYKGKWTKVCDLEYGNFSSTASQFFVGSTNVRVRIPWAALNVTDPSKRVVIEQKTPFDGQKFKTTLTNGFVPSLFVGNKNSKDTEYIFPVSKDAVGYKTYKYATWETVDYSVERKSSFGIIQNYLKSY